MSILAMSDEERKKISEQHKQLEKIAREKREELKIGLKKPEEKKKTSNQEVFLMKFSADDITWCIS